MVTGIYNANSKQYLTSLSKLSLLDQLQILESKDNIVLSVANKILEDCSNTKTCSTNFKQVFKKIGSDADIEKSIEDFTEVLHSISGKAEVKITVRQFNILAFVCLCFFIAPKSFQDFEVETKEVIFSLIAFFLLVPWVFQDLKTKDFSNRLEAASTIYKNILKLPKPSEISLKERQKMLKEEELRKSCLDAKLNREESVQEKLRNLGRQIEEEKKSAEKIIEQLRLLKDNLSSFCCSHTNKSLQDLQKTQKDIACEIERSNKCLENSTDVSEITNIRSNLKNLKIKKNQTDLEIEDILEEARISQNIQKRQDSLQKLLDQKYNSLKYLEKQQKEMEEKITTDLQNIEQLRTRIKELEESLKLENKEKTAELLRHFIYYIASDESPLYSELNILESKDVTSKSLQNLLQALKKKAEISTKYLYPLLVTLDEKNSVLLLMNTKENTIEYYDSRGPKSTPIFNDQYNIYNHQGIYTERVTLKKLFHLSELSEDVIEDLEKKGIKVIQTIDKAITEISSVQELSYFLKKRIKDISEVNSILTKGIESKDSLRNKVELGLIKTLLNEKHKREGSKVSSVSDFIG